MASLLSKKTLQREQFYLLDFAAHVPPILGLRTGAKVALQRRCLSCQERAATQQYNLCCPSTILMTTRFHDLA